MRRPEITEYSEWYSGYVSLVTETDILTVLEKQCAEVHNFFTTISEEKGLYSYAEGKWTIKEILGHLIDGERVFAYRAFRFGRGDANNLTGFSENLYVENSNFNQRKNNDLVEELVLLRRANLFVFRNLAQSDWDNSGIASDNRVTVRALAFIMVGHIRHHLKILSERYLNEI